MSKQNDSDKLQNSPADETDTSRRNFLKTAGAAGISAGAAGLGGGAVVADIGAAAPAAAQEATDEGALLYVTPDTAREHLGGGPIADAPGEGEALLAPLRERVLALRRLLTDRDLFTIPGPAGGPIDVSGPDSRSMEGAIGDFIRGYETLITDKIAARIVAHAWVNEEFKQALITPENPHEAYAYREDGYEPGPFHATKVIQKFFEGKNPTIDPGPTTIGAEGEYMRVVANGDGGNGGFTHNMVVCSLCSCYPQALLGVQPVWYKSRQYRARAVSAPRGVMREFVADDAAATTRLEEYLARVTEVRVWDSNSEVRFFVIPERPAGTESLSEEQLINLVSRNSMLGVQLAEPAV